MSLFSNLYNTLAKFFRAGDEQGDASKSVATNRLKLVLMQDRTNLTPRILEQMRSELIDLLSRYVELDKELLDLNFEQEGDQVALMLSIPVIRAKDEDEIDAAIKAREEALRVVAEKAEQLEALAENSEDTSEEASNSEEADIQDSERTEEEQAEAEKVDAIAQELKEVPKIIKKKEKKEVSAPEEINNNPFKSDSSDTSDMLETSIDN